MYTLILLLKKRKMKKYYLYLPLRLIFYLGFAFLVMYSWRLDSIDENNVLIVFAVCFLMALVPIIITFLLFKSKVTGH